MAFNPSGQRQGIISTMSGFSSISHTRPSIQQNSPAPASIHPIQSLANSASSGANSLGNGTGLGPGAPRNSTGIALNNFGTNGLTVGHLSSNHSQTQQPIASQSENSLDPSDFPALRATGQPTSTNPSNSALSYASHVNLSSTNGLPGDRSLASSMPGQRTDFTPDDFPALDATINHPPSHHHQQQQQPQQQLQSQQSQQPQQQINSTEGPTREAREQASAAAALTTQMARLNTAQIKAAPGIPESDNRSFPAKAPTQNQTFHGSIVGPSHLSNGVPSLNSHHTLSSQTSNHLSLQSGAIPPSNSHLHNSLRSPIPPNQPSMVSSRQNNLTNFHSNVALSAAPNASLHTPASQNQSIQDSGLAAENRSGTSDPSSQPTPSLDHAASVDSASQTTNRNLSIAPFFAPQTPAEQVLFGPADRFGLMHLLQIIRHADPDYSMLAMGKDLTHLGLDLGSSEALYPTFMTPWSDAKQVAAQAVEPEFTLPACYHVQPQPVQAKLPQFHEETLFFIFYSQPRDLMQELAALELYKKNWRYHKELQLWLTKESGTGPMEKTPHYERGFYVFFDPIIWKRVTKEFVLQYDQLEAKPALATNPAALQAATQLSLVYTSNGPHGKNSIASNTTSNNQTQAAQQSQQQSVVISSNQTHPAATTVTAPHRIISGNNVHANPGMVSA
ncbi:hypothetical protein O181_084489 [Austropuccinia psidii MF-1]|uniref:NOT2/NOT3/NOT5 C-terminal domain-containing protein n=1 Tax=Austropuccinia psidii MF-1 TaxID=1389203 RepID=A0A9Q3FTJ1_9BASI|nr:hypothetical protein [Austropuccinia psidii MF-1]